MNQPMPQAPAQAGLSDADALKMIKDILAQVSPEAKEPDEDDNADVDAAMKSAGPKKPLY